MNDNPDTGTAPERAPLRVAFTKMQALGNDFVMLDNITHHHNLQAGDIRTLADRRQGVGCDQVLVVEPPQTPEEDFHCRIYNADGSEVAQCGNGMRCLALFVQDRGLTAKQRLRVSTSAGVMDLHVLSRGRVRVDMGRPRLAPDDIPFRAPKQANVYELDLGDRTLPISAVSLGNPHAVTLVDDVRRAPVAELGPLVEQHEDFPEGANVGFMQVLSITEVRLRVHERGVGETPACGSGACAAVVAGRLQGHLNETVTVRLPGGALRVTWAGLGSKVVLTGTAETVYEGSVQL